MVLNINRRCSTCVACTVSVLFGTVSTSIAIGLSTYVPTAYSLIVAHGFPDIRGIALRMGPPIWGISRFGALIFENLHPGMRLLEP